MNSRNASSSELDFAGALSRRLLDPQGGTGGSATAEAPEHEGPVFARFASLARPRPATADHRTDEPAPGAFPPPGEEGYESWDALLGWCQRAYDAEVCFVVDSQGFLLHHVGDWRYSDIEDIGSQITVTLSRADDGGPTGRARSLLVEYAELWCAAMRMVEEELEDLTLVVLCRRCPAVEHVHQVALAVDRSRGRL